MSGGDLVQAAATVVVALLALGSTVWTVRSTRRAEHENVEELAYQRATEISAEIISQLRQERDYWQAQATRNRQK